MVPNRPAVPKRRVSLQCSTTKYPCTVQPPSLPAVPNRRVSLQCPTTKSPCSAQPQSIPVVPNAQPLSILALPNCKVSLQCPIAEYPCSVQPPNILQGPPEKYPCSAQWQSIPGVPNSRVSIFLQRIGSAVRKTVEGRGRATLHFLCNNGFRVGMLEVNNLICILAPDMRSSPAE